MKNNNRLTIEGKDYPYQKQGQGAIPCLCIGIGSLMQRTLSPEFKTLFTVYSTDLYFVDEYKHPAASTLTMEKMISHLLAVIEQLHLHKPFIIAHSCFGIVALEMAKNAKANFSGIILVGSAPVWNSNSIAKTEQYFQEHADPLRIANDRDRKHKYNLTKKPTDSEVSIGKYIADSARYWGNYSIGDDEIQTLWEGITVDDKVINQFFETILPQHNLAKGLEKVSLPVILLAGEYDYDSIPLIVWQHYPHPQDFTIVNCGAVGHWPHLESQSLFDKNVRMWIEKLNLVS